eukprot:4997454-Pleurochrysis_carterae.AAC.2
MIGRPEAVAGCRSTPGGSLESHDMTCFLSLIFRNPAPAASAVILVRKDQKLMHMPSHDTHSRTECLLLSTAKLHYNSN